MNATDTCLICGIRGRELVLNELPMRQCVSCDLVWRRDFDVDISHYEEKSADVSESKYTRRLNNSFDRIDTFKKYVNLNSVCDIGCGEGIFLQALSEKGIRNAIGIEPAKAASSFANSRDLRIYNGTIENATNILKRENIHVVTMFHLIEHLHNPLEAMSNLHQALPKDGVVILETPDFHCYSYRITNYRHKLIYKEHLFYFSEKSLRLLLEKAGFTIVASGKRDFDLDHMSIRELFEKLGFTRIQESKNQDKRSTESDSTERQEYKEVSILKEITRRVLARLVLFFNRADYLWCIAQKN